MVHKKPGLFVVLRTTETMLCVFPCISARAYLFNHRRQRMTNQQPLLLLNLLIWWVAGAVRRGLIERFRDCTGEREREGEAEAERLDRGYRRNAQQSVCVGCSWGGSILHTAVSGSGSALFTMSTAVSQHKNHYKDIGVHCFLALPFWLLICWSASY